MSLLITSISLNTVTTHVIIALITMPNSIIIYSFALRTSVTCISIVVVFCFHFLKINIFLQLNRWSLSNGALNCIFYIMSKVWICIAYNKEHLFHCKWHTFNQLHLLSVPVYLYELGTAFFIILIYLLNKDYINLSIYYS